MPLFTMHSHSSCLSLRILPMRSLVNGSSLMISQWRHLRPLSTLPHTGTPPPEYKPWSLPDVFKGDPIARRRAFGKNIPKVLPKILQISKTRRRRLRNEVKRIRKKVRENLLRLAGWSGDPREIIPSTKLPVPKSVQAQRHAEKIAKIESRVLNPVRVEHLDVSGDKKSRVKDASKLFAVFECSGKQYKVTEDDAIMTEWVKNVDVGQEVLFYNVLMVGSQKYTEIGRPYLHDFCIKAEVEEHLKLGKLITFKKRRRKGSKNKKGHRPRVSILRIKEIVWEKGVSNQLKSIEAKTRSSSQSSST